MSASGTRARQLHCRGGFDPSSAAEPGRTKRLPASLEAASDAARNLPYAWAA
jgi:hypothetical protein